MTSKMWRVARQEFTRHVFRRRYLFALLSLPLFAAMFAGILAINLYLEDKAQTIGLVDPARLLKDSLCADFKCFSDVAQAEIALGNGKIQAFYQLPPTYPRDSRIRLVQSEPVSAIHANALATALRPLIVERLSAVIAARLEDGARIELRTPDSARRFSAAGLFNLLAPVLLVMIFFLAIFSTSGYLMQAITTERENYTLEVLLSSLSPGQMLTGKIIGSLGAGLLQLVTWIAMAVAAVLVGVAVYGFDRPIEMRPDVILLGALSLLLAFITIAAILAAVGSLVNEAAEGQQITGPFSLPFILPLFFLMTLIKEPNGPLALVFSLVPFTAPVALTLRLSLVEVPPWQVGLSLGLQTLTALVCLWLAGRLFRLGLLQYGKPLDLRKILPRPFRPAR